MPPNLNQNVRPSAQALATLELEKGPTAFAAGPSHLRPGKCGPGEKPHRVIRRGRGTGVLDRGLGVGPWRRIGTGSFERSMIQSDYACSCNEFAQPPLLFDCPVSPVVAPFGGAIQIEPCVLICDPRFIAWLEWEEKVTFRRFLSNIGATQTKV